MTITVEYNVWDSAQHADVDAVVQSAATELLRGIDVSRSYTIHVSHWDKTYPQIDTQLDDNGRRIIRLATSGRYWCQYVLQFAHEFCHEIANFDKQNTGRHEWFEESVCELASLVTLYRMSRTWTEHPPFESWKSYAPELQRYADNRIGEPNHRLPNGSSFLEWFASERDSLERHPQQREKNVIVASQLLSLARQNRFWRAVTQLNSWVGADDGDFNAFLNSWSRQICGNQNGQNIVEEVQRVFRNNALGINSASS